jgi:hypothetical protein
MSDYGYVYLIEAIGRHKIGISGDAKSRLNSIKSTLPCEMKVINIVNAPNYKFHENLLHKIFSDKNVKGEWFDLSDENVSEVVEYMNSL